jgi:amino acid adenylation domain-containing protein
MPKNKRIEKVYPLSPMQSGMFVHALKDKTSRAYFEQFIFTIKGSIDRDLLQQSFDIILDRYDILRTVFRADKLEEPRQFVLKQRNFKLDFIDISHLNEKEKNLHLEEHTQRDKTRGFDLTRDLLLRVALLKTAPDTFWLAWSFHHILLDGWCLGIIYRDLIRSYRGLAQGKAVELDPVTPYENYIKWLQQQDKEEGLAYWQEYLGGYEQPASLPKWGNQPPQSYRQEEQDLVITEKNVLALNTMARNHQVTLNTVMQTVWGILLQKYTGLDDVVFGVVVSGRPPGIEGIEKMVGLFINTVPTRFKSQPGDSFVQLLKNTYKETVPAREYEYLSLAEIQARTPLKSNLLDHILAFENFPLREELNTAHKGQVQGKETFFYIESIRQYNQTNYDLNVIIIPRQLFIVRFNYNSSVYEREFLQRVGQHFKKVITQVIENPGIPVSRIEIITEAEKQQVIFDFNRTAADYPKERTIHRLFDEQWKRTPDHVALVGRIKSKMARELLEMPSHKNLEPGEIKQDFPSSRSGMSHQFNFYDLSYISITYRELYEKSTRQARDLKEKGVYLDTIVGIMMERSLEMIIGLLAILKADGAYLPLDPGWPQEHIDYMLKDSGAGILLTTDNIESVEDSTPVSYLSDVLHEHEGEKILAASRQPPTNSLAYLIYTSGSTGKPKGVMTEHRNAIRVVKNTNYIEFTDRDRVLQLSNYAFDGSVFDIYGALSNGACLVMIDKEDLLSADRLTEVISRQAITQFFLTTALFNTLVHLRIDAFSRLKNVLFGGETVSVRHAGKALEYLGKNKILHIYGPTETTVYATYFPLDSLDQNPRTIPIGKPISNTTVYIVDRNENLLPPMVYGELYIGGDGVCRGYLNNPELTAEKFDHDLWEYRDYRDENKNYKLQITKKPAHELTRIRTTSNKQFLRGEPRCFTGAVFSKSAPPGRRRKKLYKTGDIGCWQPGGEIEFLGRIDRQVKIRGFRIEPGEIEKRILCFKDIKEVVVTPRTDSTGDRYLCAYMVSGAKIPIPGLRHYLQQYLPAYMVPSYFIPLEKLPLTPNGKVDRNALPEPGAKPGEKYTAPRSEIEKQLAELWAWVLGRDMLPGAIGINDNFFELGGHSLKAAILTAKIHKLFDVKIPLAAIFEKPVISELARYIEARDKEKFYAIEPVEQKEYYPVSSAQKRIYLLQDLDPESTAYHIYTAFSLEGSLEESRIEQTFKQLIHRHKSLRTSFHMTDDTPVQVVHERTTFNLEFFDLKRTQVEVKVKVEEEQTLVDRECSDGTMGLAPLCVEPAAPSSHLAESTIKNFIRPFDLSRAPLIRVGLIQPPHTPAALRGHPSQEGKKPRHILIIDLHHIITDGTSMEILARDFITLYQGEKPAPLRIRYNDYSQWQNHLLNSEAMKFHESYWLNRFAGGVPVLTLPYDYPRPGTWDFQGNTLAFAIEKMDSQQLKQLALENEASLFMVLLAIFNVFLAKISGQEHIVVGTPSAGRKHPDIEKIMGMFVNTLVLSSSPTNEKTFSQFLKEVKQHTLEAFENQDYPFENLVDKVVKYRDTSRSPLFDAMLALQNLESEVIEIPGMKLKPYPLENRTAKFDITFIAVETGDQILFTVEYRTALFKKTTVERWIRYFKQIIASILANQEQEISKIQCPPGQEQDRLPVNLNTTPANDELEQILVDTWKEVLNLDEVGIHDNFFELGGNSLKIMSVNKRLSGALGMKIPAVNLFKYPTISSLKEYLQRERTRINPEPEGQPEPPPSSPPLSLEIAIIGMAGRFPGADYIQQFWENLQKGIESISFFSGSELEEAGIPPQLLAEAGYVKARGIIDFKDRFDAAFFYYTPTEAQVMDPQARLLHECAWEALEDAGYNPETYNKRIGIFTGASSGTCWEARVHLSTRDRVMDPFESYQLANNHFMATRISYKLNLKGPAVFIHSGCSTSLTAVHLACNAIQSGDCTMVLAGGICLSPEKKGGYLYREGLVMSPDGHCRAFDARAGGAVSGEGAGVVLLKSLVQALDDNDHIYAVIKATAANNDGARKVGYSAPSIDGQAEAIAAVYRKASVTPESITYIETHGTGTVLGDPIEIAALKQAFKTQKKGFCALGSVKTNLGHLDSAAGVASLIKTILALVHKKIPPTLYFEVPNPEIDLADSPFYINTTLVEWEPGPTPRRAGVSSFGIGGTNAHVILEEFLPPAARGGSFRENRPPCPPPQKLLIIPLSAKTPTALLRMTQNLANYLKENRGTNLADISFTLQMGRKSFNHRWMMACSTGEEALEILTTPGKGETHHCLPGEEKTTPLIIDAADDKVSLLEIGQQWLHGQEIDWKRFYTKEKPNRLSLPTYPFEVDGQHYWFEQDPLTGAEFKNLSIDVRPVKKPGIADWFYLPHWIRSTPVPPVETGTKTKSFLALINQCPLVIRLVEQLRSRSHAHPVITLEPGSAFRQKGNHEFTINPHNYQDYFELLTRLNRQGLSPTKILHFWNVTAEDYHPEPGKVDKGFYSLLYLARAIRKRDSGGEIGIDLVTTGLQDVTGDETLIPEKAAALGPIKVIPQEYPFILCRTIDLRLPLPGSPLEEQLTTCLIDEFSAPLDSQDTDIAYRGRYRWIKTYEPVRIESPEPNPVRLKKRGIYLLTGGYGNIGLTLSAYLAENLHPRLILTGPTPLPARREWDHWLQTHQNDPKDKISRKIKRIHHLEDLGAEVRVFTADAADRQAMATVVRETEKIFGPIDGVIHAAGLIRGKSIVCPIEELDEEVCLRQFRPKIQGTLVLADLFKDKALDFCILTSSLAEILGGLGFAAYGAANAFMDVFATRESRTGPGRWLSVNWADWGFTREKEDDPDSENTNIMAPSEELTITPAEGVETFKRLLGLVPTGTAQVAVSSGDLRVRIDRWVKLRWLRNSHTTAAEAKSSMKLQSRPTLSTPFIAPQTPLEQDIAHTWKKQLGFEKIGVHDDFFQLGGDSLKAISLLSRLHKELNARITLKEFFARATVQSLARFIAGTEKPNCFHTPVQPAEKREYYILSPLQKQLYLLDLSVNTGTAYNLTVMVELEGVPDRELLEEVFAALIKRHEITRTSFIMVEDKPVQRIHDKVSFPMEELSKEDKKGKNYQLQMTGLLENFIRPFDLSRAPLLRVGLMEKAKESHLLVLDTHHIISDGYTHPLFITELISLYEKKSLPALRLHYKDYSLWHYSPGQQEILDKQEKYWLETLAGQLPVLDLPTDYPRPVYRSFAGTAVKYEINPKETKALHQLALEEGATLYMVLLAAYSIFLAKLTGQEDILVGTLTAGRRHADLENIAGMFINTLVIRSHPSSPKGFRRFLHQVKERTLQAFENQDYPFEDLAEKLVKEKDSSRNPFFDVMFVLQNMVNKRMEFPQANHGENRAGKLKANILPRLITATRFDLILEVSEADDRLFLLVEFSTRLFREETIARFVAYYKKILSSIIRNPDIKISGIETLLAKEKKQESARK